MFLRFYLLVIVLLLAGCATVSSPQAQPTSKNQSLSGINYVVQKGDTLWRISKSYNVDLEQIAKANNITDSSTLTTGQTLYIPGATSKKQYPETNFSSQGNSDFIWPSKGTTLAYFRQKTNGIANKGIDIATANRQDIYACGNGKIIFIGPMIGYGDTIIIDHGDNLTSVYCGSSDITVRVGDEVKQGTSIAKTKSLPRYKEDTLHFEIRKKNKPLNPLYFLS